MVITFPRGLASCMQHGAWQHVVLPEKTEVRELLTTAYKTNTTWGGRKGGGVLYKTRVDVWQHDTAGTQTQAHTSRAVHFVTQYPRVHSLG